MTINFQSEPFFDDYSEDKQFYRILYRPGYAVQARELTQMQTILQEQIRRHGDHIFKEGSMVIPGQISYDLEVFYVKLLTPENANTEATLKSLVGRVITNDIGVTAKVLTYQRASGTSDPYDTLFVKFLSSAQELNVDNELIDIKVFRSQEELNPEDGTTGLTVYVAEDDVADNPVSVGFSSIANIQKGVYYIKKHFVLVPEQTIVLDKFMNTPTYRVGLKLIEDVVYPEQDESLLDNSTGSPNYAAPGAARYYIDLELVKLDPLDEVDENFIDLLRLENGRVLHKIDRTQYAELEKTLARRTYDESGDYCLSPFNIHVREYRNNFRGDWQQNTVYIQGDIIRRPGLVNARDYFVATTNGISGNNINLNWSPSAQFVEDGIGDNQVIWEYVTVPLFNRGVYSFPSNEVKYQSFTINDHIRLSGLLAIGIEKNKAYVRGYEIEKLATEYLTVQKSRDFPASSSALASYLGLGTSPLPALSASVSGEKNITIDLSMGSYVIAESVLFAPNIINFGEVLLHPVVHASATTVSYIGTARVRALEFHETGKYKVFLSDIKMREGNTFDQVKSICGTSSTLVNNFRCNFILENGIAVIKDPENTSLIKPIPNYAIKQIKEVDYFVVGSFTQTAVSNAINITAPLTHFFASTANQQNYIVINNTTGAIVTSPTISTSNANQILTVSGLTNSQSYTVLATLQVVNSENESFKYNAELTDDFDGFTTAEEVRTPIITLDQSFVVRIVSVMMNPNGYVAGNDLDYSENITNRYTFNDGQTNYALNKAYIELKPGADYPKGAIRVYYEYVKLTENYKSNFVCVNSYTYSDTSRIRYDQIPTFGNSVLRDSLDFRPFYLNTGAVFQEKYLPKYGYNVSVKYDHYLPRLDNLSLTSSGKYIVSSGYPSLNVMEPGIPDNSMKIATLALEPYTFRTDQNSVRIDKVENKRYTMRDIGKLERRIKDLEYYTSLSLLELDTKNTKIIDSNGFDRLQNGFIVDTFVDQSIGNVSSTEWNASIDSSNSELRPFFSQKQVYLLENVDAAIKNYTVSGDLISLPYQETAMISQLKGSTTENVNPFALYSWRGIMGLNPWSDTWFSTERRPDIIINDEGQYNAVVAKAEEEGVLGTIWNSWQTVFSSSRSLESRLENLGQWSSAQTQILNDANKGSSFWRARSTFTQEELNFIGVTDGDLWSGQAWAVAGSRVVTVETAAVETTSARAGVKTFVVDKVDSRVLDDRVVETRIVPYIRSRSVLFAGYAFKPNTRLYAFFDGTNVDDYITSAIKIKVSRVQNNTGGYFTHRFDTVRNAGSNVENVERLVRNGEFDDVEIAFNHGEVVREVNGNGRTAIVVGQETVGTDFFIYVMNVKNSDGTPATVAANTFSLAQGSYLRGEYLTDSGDYSRVKVVSVEMDYHTGPLRTSGTGVVFGTFRIPNDPQHKFRTGTREFKLIDDSSNDDRASSTSSSAFYEANGLIEVKQRTILSTRTAELVSENLSEENTVITTNDRITRDTGWFDPLAQTFLVQKENGAFITSADIFFQTVDENVPVRVEIREVVNGYPGRKVLPFSRVERKGSSITTSTNGSVATNFKFDSPVYLQNGVEYALVVLSDSNQYRIFIAQTDTIDLITGYRISSQPYAGVLFKSQNGSTWTADQTQDMKFVIYHAQFNTSPIDVEFVTNTLPKKNLGINPLAFKRYSKKIRVSHPNHGMKVGDIVELTANQVYENNMIRGISTSNIFKQHEIISCTLDDYVVEVTGTDTADSDGQSGGSFVYASEYYTYQTAMADISQLEIPGTRIEYSIRTTDESSSVIETNGRNITVKENMAFESSKVLRDPGSIIINAKLISDSPNVSPIIDVGRAALTLVNNKVDNMSYLDNDLDIDSETMVGVETDISQVAVSSNVVTITIAGGHTYLVGQRVDVYVGTSAYSYLSGTHVITNVTSTTFTYTLSAADLTAVAATGLVTPLSTEIGSGKPFTFNSGENSITTTTDYTSQFSKLNKLKPGNILRFNYDETVDAEDYFVVTGKYLSNNGSANTVTIILEPEAPGSILRETGVSEKVEITLLKKYVSEVGTEIGTVTSKYVTKKINLSRPSEMIRMMFAAALPFQSSIQVFYKTGLNAASDDFLSSRYIEVKPSAGYNSSEEFIDYTIDVEDLIAFDTLIVKIVMRSSNKASVPKIKDLRIIACAA